MATAFEVLIGVLVASRRVEPDVDNNDEIQRDERVIETVDGIEDREVQSLRRPKDAKLGERKRGAV